MSRDRTIGDTFYIAFPTRSFATGDPVPTTLAGSPVVSAYEDGSTTEITAGITLSVDHDSITGFNLLTIVATGGNGFETGKDYNLVITAGTVGGIPVVGEVVDHFSLGLSASFVSLAGGVLLSAAATSLQLVKDIWDRVLTGGTHNIQNSAGKRLRDITSGVIRTGTAQGPGTGNNQIQLDAGASSVDGTFDPGLILITAGTGAGQARLIIDYEGATTTATVDKDWKGSNPDNTSEFVVIASAGRLSVNEGLAVAGTSNTITLNATAIAVNGTYKGQTVHLRSGTGQDQASIITAYDGGTKIATVSPPWVTIPDTTTGYAINPTIGTDAPTIATTLDVNVIELAGNAEAATDLSFSARTIVRATAITGTLSTTQMSTDLTEATDDHYQDRTIIWTSGVLKDQGATIEFYTGATKVLTFTATTEAPSNTDTFVIV